MKSRIIVDSTADLMPEFKNRVYTVPLTVNFGEEEFIDGVTITREEFYAKLIESDVIPTTSQATPEAFERVFKKLVENGDLKPIVEWLTERIYKYGAARKPAEALDNCIHAPFDIDYFLTYLEKKYSDIYDL